jgi:hypothetical protein
MHDIEDPRPLVDLAVPAVETTLVDAHPLSVFAYDAYDVMGAGDTVRVLVVARSNRQAAHRIRRAGFRVRRWTTPLARIPHAEAARALAAPGVVMWRNHDPELAEQWFYLPR